MYFGLYDTAKEQFDKPNFLTKFAIAQSVATVSVTLSYPFDTVRRRLMYVLITCFHKSWIFYFYDRFMVWFHEILFNEFKNFFNKIFCVVFIGFSFFLIVRKICK